MPRYNVHSRRYIFTLWGTKDKYHTGTQKFLHLFQKLMNLHTGLWVSHLTQSVHTLRGVYLLDLVDYAPLAQEGIPHLSARESWTNHSRNSGRTSRQLMIYSAQNLYPMSVLFPTRPSLNGFSILRNGPWRRHVLSKHPVEEGGTRAHTLTLPYSFLHPNIVPLPVQFTPTPTPLLVHLAVVCSHSLEE